MDCRAVTQMRPEAYYAPCLRQCIVCYAAGMRFTIGSQIWDIQGPYAVYWPNVGDVKGFSTRAAADAQMLKKQSSEHSGPSLFEFKNQKWLQLSAKGKEVNP